MGRASAAPVLRAGTGVSRSRQPGPTGAAATSPGRPAGDRTGALVGAERGRGRPGEAGERAGARRLSRFSGCRTAISRRPGGACDRRFERRAADRPRQRPPGPVPPVGAGAPGTPARASAAAPAGAGALRPRAPGHDRPRRTCERVTIANVAILPQPGTPVTPAARTSGRDPRGRARDITGSRVAAGVFRPRWSRCLARSIRAAGEPTGAVAAAAFPAGRPCRRPGRRPSRRSGSSTRPGRRRPCPGTRAVLLHVHAAMPAIRAETGADGP